MAKELNTRLARMRCENVLPFQVCCPISFPNDFRKRTEVVSTDGRTDGRNGEEEEWRIWWMTRAVILLGVDDLKQLLLLLLLLYRSNLDQVFKSVLNQDFVE